MAAKCERPTCAHWADDACALGRADWTAGGFGCHAYESRRAESAVPRTPASPAPMPSHNGRQLRVAG